MLDTITLLKEKIDAKDILQNEPMSKHTTFKVGGNADLLIKVHNIEQIKFVLNIARDNNIPIFILGNGSNLLVKDKGIRGITLKPELKDIKIERKDKQVYVTVGSGNKMPEIAGRLLREEITGFEFAAGIPGTIGGFVRMNAGAYGSEARDIVTETTILTYDGNIKKIVGEEHHFEYRKSAFLNMKIIILDTKLKLSYGKKDEIQELMEKYRKSRFEKQPIEFPSAGSTFKRGNDFISAKLIDECGLKGYSIGGAMVSKKHAGFIVNTGNANAGDILELIDYVKKIVLENTGKELKLEIEIVGED
ncbi:MAG: UDP-N-acetylmuramate dehydrogenase [Clostridia bacterium]|nr:UDP-N-acetylmuramate dehydrogenase [Clostridia bacterium]